MRGSLEGTRMVYQRNVPPMAVSPDEIRSHLAEVAYPATKERLMLAVRDHGAHDDVLEILDSLGDREYADTSDVMSELGAVVP